MRNVVVVRTVVAMGLSAATAACVDDDMAASTDTASIAPRPRNAWSAADGGGMSAPNTTPEHTRADAGKAQPAAELSGPAMMAAAARVPDAGSARATEEADAGSDDDAGPALPARSPLIQFNPMYSAYDGVHIYQLTPSVPRAADDALDPVDPASVTWTIDNTHLSMAAFPDLSAGILLTTKRAGVTTVRVDATTRAGDRVHDEADVFITEVGAGVWDIGAQRFAVGDPVSWTPPCNSPDQLSGCMLPCSAWAQIPQSSACAGCHTSMSAASHAIAYTPTQTAGYSDEQLSSIFTVGWRPNYTTFDSALLQGAAEPRCLFYQFHIWELSDEETRGVIAQLRAIRPRANEAIDRFRLHETPAMP